MINLNEEKKKMWKKRMMWVQRGKGKRKKGKWRRKTKVKESRE